MVQSHLLNKYLKKHSGQSLVELLLAIGLLAIVIPSILTIFVVSRQGKPQQQERTKAVAALQEAEEAVRVIRQTGWTNIADKTSGANYHPVISGNNWTLDDGEETIDAGTGLTRTVVIDDVYRSSAGAIVPEGDGATLDPSSKKVTITVSWDKPYASSLSTTTYLTRYLDNVVWTQTTTDDFSLGTVDSTQVVSTTGTSIPDDGEVELQSGHANWCDPTDYIVNHISLPHLSNAIHAQEGHAWLGAGDGNASDPQFINVQVDDSGDTPLASVVGTFNGKDQVNDIFSDGNYVYLATNYNTSLGQIIILDISNPTNPSRVGSIKLSGSTDAANGVYVVGNILYATSGKYIYSYNVTNKNNPTKLGQGTLTNGFIFDILGGYFFPDTVAKQIVVIGNKAYVGAGNTLFGLQVFSISADYKTFIIYAVANFPYTQESQGLYVNSGATRAYLAFNNGGGGYLKGFYIVNLTYRQRLPYPYSLFFSTYVYNNVNGNGTSTGTMDPRGMTIVDDDNKAIIVGVGGNTIAPTGDNKNEPNRQYQVFNIQGNNEQHPTQCGSLYVKGGVNGISSILNSDGNAFSYITTGDTDVDQQFKIIEGGDGAAGPSTGYFTSSPLSVSYPTSVNYFSADVSQPGDSNIQLQVAGATPTDGDDCSSPSTLYNFVGPDGSTGSYFTESGGKISGTVPFGTYDSSPNYTNPAKCFKYKATFNAGSSGQEPILYDTNFNHSP